MGEPFNACSYLVDRRVAAGDGDRVAVRDSDRALRYDELAAESAAVAAGFAAIGVRPEERVMFVMVDGMPLLAGILGAMRLGAVAVPVSTMITGKDLAGILVDSRARTLVVGAELVATAAAAIAGAPDLTDVVLAGEADLGRPAGVRLHAWADLRAAGEPVPVAMTWDDSPALWLYTSGTTGTPKAAMHRHANFRHVADTFGRQVLGITPEDVCYSVAKLFFAYGLGNSATFPLSVGATTVLDPARPTPAGVAARVRSEAPTLFFAVPTFYAALLAADLPSDTFGSVRHAVSAGEALPAQVFTRFRDRFGVEIIDGLGSTEALHIFLSNRPGEVRPGTTGRPVPGYDLRLLAEDGRPVPPGEPGALYVKGASLATGYWCRTDVTRKVFQGEWLRTGDTYVGSPDGYYTCLGRSDDMLKAGGIWVSPAEVEARLLEHRAVAEAAVVGLPDEDGIDKPVACVVAAPGTAPDPAELLAFCRDGLAAYKRPRHVLVVAELPKTATGKLQRFVVKGIAADRLAQRSTAPPTADPVAVTPTPGGSGA